MVQLKTRYVLGFLTVLCTSAALAASAMPANAVGSGPPILIGDGGPNSVGFGRVRPPEIYLGGDVTGEICHIHWTSWGSQFAVGTATAWYLHGGQITADGHWAPAIVVLYHLSTWHGEPAYTKYTVSYPQGGSTYGGVRACTG